MAKAGRGVEGNKGTELRLLLLKGRNVAGKRGIFVHRAFTMERL
jgi:hypothetical protein